MRLHIVSWNVASLKRVHEQIKRNHGSMRQFLDRHAIDILCLQETKVSLSIAATRDGAERVGLLTTGFDAFLCPCRSKEANKKGFNGVATFARKGLTLSANAAPLGDKELDDEGRCIVTDHGPFLIFNVYVPNAGGGKRLPFKLKFIRKLRQVIDEMREATGKHIILVGDLNMHRRAVDIFPKGRRIHIPTLVEDNIGVDRDKDPTVTLKGKVTRYWKDLQKMLRESRVVRPKFVKSSSKGTVKKFVVTVCPPASSQYVQIGSTFDSEAEASGLFGDYSLDESYGNQEKTSETPRIVTKPANCLSVGQLVECMQILGAALTRPEIEALERCGGTRLPEGEREFFDAISAKMTDSFAFFHPRARGRYTCWNQHKNRRFENDGARIDYILVDSDMFRRHAKRGKGSLYSGGPAWDPTVVAATETIAGIAADSERAALSAATAGGRFKPAGYDGGGLQDLNSRDCACQFQRPITGIVYTPPQYSDHVAVSLILEDVDALAPVPGTIGRAFDARTRRCQPWSKQRLLKSFFGVGSATSAPNASSSVGREKRRASSSFAKNAPKNAPPPPPSKKTKRSGAPKKGTIASFFLSKSS
eukprot:g2072.t1